MIKLMMTWRDNPEKGADGSDAHYLAKHTEMGLATLADVPGFLRYTQNRVTRHFVHRRNGRETEDREPEFHRTIEIYFTDEEALMKVFNRPEMDVMFADHPNFMDADADPSQCVYLLEEVVALERGMDGTLMAPITARELEYDWPPTTAGS